MSNEINTTMRTIKSNYDLIHYAIESITMKFVTNIHDEAKGYAFKTWQDQKWHIISFEFANDIAGLGDINNSLL